MKITDISPFKGKTLRIDLEGAEPVFINADVAAEYRLVKGMDIPSGAVDEIIRANDARRAKERALYLLDVRDYSYVELFKKLEANYPEDICFEVCNRLAEIGCINDRRYAVKWAEHLCLTKKYGYYKAREELKRKGLAKELIDEALEPYKEDAVLRITELLDRKYARYLSDEKGVAKVKAALARLGYSYHDINSALSEYEYNE